jgi:hypothetical protein
LSGNICHRDLQVIRTFWFDTLFLARKPSFAPPNCVASDMSISHSPRKVRPQVTAKQAFWHSVCSPLGMSSEVMKRNHSGGAIIKITKNQMLTKIVCCGKYDTTQFMSATPHWSR